MHLVINSQSHQFITPSVRPSPSQMSHSAPQSQKSASQSQKESEMGKVGRRAMHVHLCAQ